jgi:nucleotide-binding universal stress UspA family protein
MKPILLATDGSATAAEAAKKAIELATALDAPLLVASIWDVAYEPIGFGFAPILPDVDRLGHEQAQRIVDEAAKPARDAGLEVETIIRRGRPVEQVCRIADEYDPYLIVLGAHGWGTFRRTLFGSVSTGVLHQAHQPVLVVRGLGDARLTEMTERKEVAV